MCIMVLDTSIQELSLNDYVQIGSLGVHLGMHPKLMALSLIIHNFGTCLAINLEGQMFALSLKTTQGVNRTPPTESRVLIGHVMILNV